METRKLRSDIALTLELTRAIFERLESGQPLIKRGVSYLLLDNPKWANKVPVGTYNSWRNRNTIPIDMLDNRGFNELLVEARGKMEEEKLERLLRLGERGFKKILAMPLQEKVVHKCINKNGKEYARRIIERINPSVISAKLKLTIFAIERAGSKGRYANAKK
jgi:hypothetical protein